MIRDEIESMVITSIGRVSFSQHQESLDTETSYKPGNTSLKWNEFCLSKAVLKINSGLIRTQNLIIFFFH